jgi:hypothetical protein
MYAHIEWLGELRSWMAFHVFTGVVGCAIVLFHSTFLMRSALGSLAFSAMAIVIVTGVVGRYIYAVTPRSVKGVELELADIRRDLESNRKELETLGMPAAFFETMGKYTRAQARPDASVFDHIGNIIVGNRQLREQYAEVEQLVRSNPSLEKSVPLLLPLARRYMRERQWADRYSEFRSLMGTWRFMHRWLAIAMLSAVIFHIIIAVGLGNLWIFQPKG